eukprot:scaffold52100_cov36-Attheya_sp.AAC.6
MLESWTRYHPECTAAHFSVGFTTCTEVNRLSYGRLLDPRLEGDSFTFHWTKIIQVTFFLGAGANL